MRQDDAGFSRSLRRHGFRKWYERELLSGHAHMVLALLAVIGLMASIEAFDGADMAGKLLDVSLVIVSAAIGLWALRRYLFLLMHAEEVANQAHCSQCQAYGRLEPTGEVQEDGLTSVRCRGCGHHWSIRH